MAVNMQQQKRTAAISLAVLLLGCSCLATVQARVQQMGEIRILAVGDSITQGSVPSKGANHPYTIKLKELLQSKYPGMNVVIDNDGMCSIDKATGALLHKQPAQAAFILCAFPPALLAAAGSKAAAAVQRSSCRTCF